MKKLFVFGCSFTQPYFDMLNHDGSVGTYTQYRMWKGGTFPKTWSEILSDQIGYELRNYARGGSCNYHTIKAYNDHCHEIEEGDLVIIQWTYVERFWTVMNERELINVAGPWQFDSLHIGSKTAEETYVNRSYKPWVNEIYSFEKNFDQMAKLGKHNIFYWSACDQIINSESQEFKNKSKYLLSECDKSVITYFADKYDNLRIYQETKTEVGDAHYGEFGQKFLSDKIYEQLKERNVI